MGTDIHCRSYSPGFYSMRDLNEDLSSSSWPLFYGGNTVSNEQYCNGFGSRASITGYSGDDKETLRQKMLEHEADFKNQVSELHRVYRVQREMMDEIRRRELDMCRVSIEPASSSSLQASQAPSEGTRTWHMAGFSLLNSSYGGTPTSEIELVKSPMNCTKVNTAQPGPFPFPNSSTSKDNKVMDSRPSKVRKKLFDLHLPPEEYMDTEEQKNLTETDISVISRYSYGNPSSGGDPNMKLLVSSRDDVKTYCRVDTSASASSVRGATGLVDLNDPPESEEPAAPSSIDFIGCTSKNKETRDLNQPIKQRGLLINLESNGYEVGRFPNIREAGKPRSNLTSVSQSHQLHKSPFPSRPIPNQVHHPPGVYPTDYRREDRWKEGLHRGSEFSNRSCDTQAHNHWEPLTSETPGSYPLSNASCVAYSWDHHISSQTNPSSSFAPNVTAPGVSPISAATTCRRFYPSAWGLEPFGGKWKTNAISGLNPGLKIESNEKGFHSVSTSASWPKELKGNLLSPHIDYSSCSRRDGQASDCPSSRVLEDFPMGPCSKNLKGEIDINLNDALLKSSSNEVEIKQDLSKTDGKSKLVLPWFKLRPEVPKGCKNAIDIDVNQPIMPNGECNITGKDATGNQAVKKLLGFPIFEPNAPEDDPSCPASTSACHPEGKYSDSERKKAMIDINVVCEVDDEMAVADATMAKEEERRTGACVRDDIDLNSCASDSEDPQPPCCRMKTAQVKVALEIDLEAPPPLENEDDDTLTEQNVPSDALDLGDKRECVGDDVLRDAAEVMVAISSSYCDSTGICDPPEPSLEESLLWFVDAVTSSGNEPDNTSRFKQSALQWNSSAEIDEFEAMTLQLAEAKEESYIPRPFALDIQQVDARTNLLPIRTRRGQARRGRQRQRRDFQRDILPGLASLSRHEATEDLQTFTGLMRAIGHHSWSSGLTRRNGTRSGSSRGRRRAATESTPAAVPSPACIPPMQQCTNTEPGLEDRNLMGWEKTTRRPRRQ